MTSSGRNKGGGGQLSPNAQSLLPQELREANNKISGLLTKLQQNIRQLEQSKNQIGTLDDNYELRQALLAKQKETKKMANNLENEIKIYGDISVAFNQ